ncbi:MAG: hypothetical protein JETT_1888 [Candidatus Jettenia ecosi]|uniref:Lipoprotein n=1 Tax=Candidatus Jettenia ecosi TaxID=2494326 RepID=A0A533QGS8_9BACT|nr:MAG: hypothetical protein JETT_1888 [Candidatus Jettenia ecosi]
MRNIAIFIVLLFLTSCTQVPKESAYLLGYQKKMQASKHWNKLAKKVAEDVKSKIENEKDSVFMSDADQSPFGKAMRTLLATELHHQGLVLTAVETNPYKLVLEVQPVFHAADRRNNSSLLWLMLVDFPQYILLGETDFSRTKPHSEIIITYELLKNERRLLRNNTIFYVNDTDRNHYWESVATTGLSLVRYSVKNN